LVTIEFTGLAAVQFVAMVKISHVSQDLPQRLHDKKMAANVELERQKSKAKFSIPVSTVYNVTFKTIEDKLKLID